MAQEKTLVFMRPIGDGFVAYLPGVDEWFEVRSTRDEALGALVSKHPDKFNLNLASPIFATSPTDIM